MDHFNNFRGHKLLQNDSQNAKMWSYLSSKLYSVKSKKLNSWDFDIWRSEKFKFENWLNLKFASQLRKEPELWVKYVSLFFIFVKLVATESGVKMETPKSIKRIPLPFSVDPNPRESVPDKLCFLGFIKLVNC